MIGRPGHLLLTTLARFGYLSAQQATELLYSPASLNFVRDHLKELARKGYTRHCYRPSQVPHGKPLRIHLLSGKGGKYTQTTPPDPEVGFQFLTHTLAANQLVVLSRLLTLQDPASELLAYRTERELKQLSRSSVIPDGWVHLRRHWPTRPRPIQHYLAWELDRGTIHQRAFRLKLQALVSWVDASYTDLFGATGLTLAFVVAAGSRNRLDNLVRWAEAELAHSAYKDLFLFAAFDPERIDPLQLFLEPIWRLPFSPRPTTLLASPQPSSSSSSS